MNFTKISMIVFSAFCCFFLFSSSLALAGQRLDNINEHKVIKVGTPGDYRPFAILTDGKYEGHDIDVINLIADELGVKIEFVPTTWPKLLDDFEAGHFDVALGGITRNLTRISKAEFLPGYAPFGKVALIRTTDKDKLNTLEKINNTKVKVIKNPGGSNEKYVLENLDKAQVSTHDKNAEIPGLIAEGQGDVMITETYEALVYAQKDPRLFAAFIDAPLTPVNTLGFMIQKDDPDFVRVLNFAWTLLETRGKLAEVAQKWLK